MVRSSILLIVTVLAAAALASGASAAPFILSDATDFEGTLQVPGDPGAGGATPDTIGDGFLLLSGSLRFEGDIRGPVFGMQSRSGTTIEAETIRIYDTNDPLSIAQQRPVVEITDGTLRPDEASSFFWSIPEGHGQGTTPYSFGFLYQLEANLPAGEFLLPQRDGPPPPSLIAQATDPWSFTAPGDERSLYLPIGTGFRTVDANGTEQRFDGTEWLVSLRGETRAEIEAYGIATPFSDAAQAELGPADADTFAAAFSVENLQTFLALVTDLADQFQPPAGLPDEGAEMQQPPEDDVRRPQNRSHSFAARQAPGGGPAPEGPLTDEVADVLVSIAPLLNGALFGQPVATFDVGGTETDASGFSLIRFSDLTVRGEDHDTVTLDGHAPFAFAGGAVHHDTNILRVGPIVIPILSIALYVIAIGAWFGSRAWTLRPLDEDQTARLRMPAILTQWGLIVIAFVLFDREVHYVLGQSLLSQLGGYGAVAEALPPGTMALAGTALVVVLQVGLWAAASAAFGVPIAIIGRAALRVAGLGRGANGFAVALGALFTWLLGHVMILPILDVAFGAVASATG